MTEKIFYSNGRKINESNFMLVAQVVHHSFENHTKKSREAWETRVTFKQQELWIVKRIQSTCFNERFKQCRAEPSYWKTLVDQIKDTSVSADI